MRKQTSTRDMAGVGRRLHEDHLAFEDRFDALCKCAEAGAWRELDEVWSAFVRDIEEHFRFEEERVFPGFGRRGPECRELVDSLSAEHAEVRHSLESLGLQIQLHEIRATTIERFVDLMRKHAEVENAHIYPWLDLEGRQEDAVRAPLGEQVTLEHFDGDPEEKS
jgi:hypothetical protein